MIQILLTQQSAKLSLQQEVSAAAAPPAEVVNTIMTKLILSIFQSWQAGLWWILGTTLLYNTSTHTAYKSISRAYGFSSLLQRNWEKVCQVHAVQGLQRWRQELLMYIPYTDLPHGPVWCGELYIDLST